VSAGGQPLDQDLRRSPEKAPGLFFQGLGKEHRRLQAKDQQGKGQNQGQIFSFKTPQGNEGEVEQMALALNPSGHEESPGVAAAGPGSR
jgi:hypothetical protein